jgi:hypothetical protein
MSTIPRRQVPLSMSNPVNAPRTVRRSTRSCSECKFIYICIYIPVPVGLGLTNATGRRRKVRCQLSSDKNVIVCSACIQRDTPCVVQEWPPSISSIADVPKLDERLGRVEGLLEKLVDVNTGVISADDRGDHQISSTAHSISELSKSILSNGSNAQNTPVLSLFDNELVSHLNHKSMYSAHV